MIDKIAGVVFGTAIGDSLGYAVEFDASIKPGPPFKVTDLKLTGKEALYSDDTQMMRAVLEGLLRSRTWGDVTKAAEEVAEEFIAWLHSPENNRAPGNACLYGCHRLEQGVPWMKSGKPAGKGCGTAMRSMAYGMWFPGNAPLAAQWAALHANMTHISDEAQAAAAAVAAMVSIGIGSGDVDRMVYAAMYEARRDTQTRRLLSDATHMGRDTEPHDEILDEWRGWRGSEALAASVYCFLRHPRDYEAAVTLAVNTPGDSDSLGAITGALVGSVVGFERIPEKWSLVIEKREQLYVLCTRVVAALEG